MRGLFVCNVKLGFGKKFFDCVFYSYGEENLKQSCYERSIFNCFIVLFYCVLL